MIDIFKLKGKLQKNNFDYYIELTSTITIKVNFLSKTFYPEKQDYFCSTVVLPNNPLPTYYLFNYEYEKNIFEALMKLKGLGPKKASYYLKQLFISQKNFSEALKFNYPKKEKLFTNLLTK